jgi:ribonuclease J
MEDRLYLKNKKRIKGIFLSHGHEGNIGAVPDLVNKLGDVPIYGGKLTLEILRIDLEEAGIKKANLHEIKAHRKLNFGSESIFPIAMTHSIPDAFCYVLYTKDGAIVYTGDFTFDHATRSLYQTDLGKLAYVGKQGVLCLLAESLYAARPGYTSPNHRVQDFIRTILTKNEDRIIVTIFPAHFYRIQELFDEISQTHRKIVIMGKSLQSMINYGIENKYLEVNPKVIGDLSNLNDKDVVVFISDEREKPFANLERIIKGYDKFIKLKDTDTIFISEPSAEGMERRLALIMDEIAMLGVNAISLSSKKHLLHHASSEDLKMMLNLLRPKYLFPVKGEYRNQYAFAEIAEEMNIPKENIFLKQNGDVVTLENGVFKDTEEHINVDEILIDGKDSSDIGNLVLKDREMLGENGIVIISCTLDRETKEVVAGPKILTRGFIYVKENQDLVENIKNLSKEVIESNIETGTKKVDYAKIKADVRDQLGKYLYQEIGSKPMIITVVQEV